MIKGNTLDDMHNMLMEQMTRLMECESDEELDKEVKRSKQIQDIAKVVVENSKTILEANKVALEYGINTVKSDVLSLEYKK